MWELIVQKLLRREYRYFSCGIKGLSALGYRVQQFADDAYAIAEGEGSEIDLVLMALVHGNEYGGLAVLNRIIRLLSSGYSLRIRLVLVLGNYRAATLGVRFVDRDLNRCFGEKDGATHEGRRATELGKILASARFLVDFHQTFARCRHGFTIFPFSVDNVAFAHHVDPRGAIVTRFAGNFSADGLCSDEFVLQRGGAGITVELGQAGFCSTQVTRGFWLACRALGLVNSGQPVPSLVDIAPVRDVYTFAQVVPYRAGYRLVDDLYNFKRVTRGEKLLQAGDKDLIVSADGYVLFPKYVFRTPPSELCHVVEKKRLTEVLKK